MVGLYFLIVMGCGFLFNGYRVLFLRKEETSWEEILDIIDDERNEKAMKNKLASENIPVAFIGTTVVPCSNVHVPVPEVPPNVQDNCSSYTINAFDSEPLSISIPLL